MADIQHSSNINPAPSQKIFYLLKDHYIYIYIYKYFSTVAEKYLFEASKSSKKHHLGRGKVPKIVHEQRFCPQAPNGTGCESTLVRRLKRILRKLKHLVHLCNNGMRNSWKAEGLWDVLSPSHDFLRAHISITLPGACPPHAQLLSFTTDIRKAVQKVQAAEVSRRVTIARHKFHDDWRKNPAVIFAKVNPNVVAPTYILQDQRGNLTGNFQDMERLLKEAWLPIFHKYSSCSEPSWDDFQKRYMQLQYFVLDNPMTLRPFNIAGLRSVLQKNQISSRS